MLCCVCVCVYIYMGYHGPNAHAYCLRVWVFEPSYMVKMCHVRGDQQGGVCV